MGTMTEFYAFVAVEGPDAEGIVATHIRDQGWMPLIAADADRLASLRPMAAQMVAETGMQLELRRFVLDHDWPVETIAPPKQETH